MHRTIKELRRLYPDIEWFIIEPNDDVLETYGNGTILAGRKNGEVKDFFILEKDPRKLEWGHVIANYLNGTVEEEYDGTED